MESGEATAEERDPTAEHLRSCGVCRRWTVGRLLGLWGQEGPPPGSRPRSYDYGPVFERVQASLPQLVRQIRQRREEAVGLLAELRSLPEERRRRATRDPRFHNPALVELLLDAGQAAQRKAPAEAEALAGLAAELAARAEHSPDDLASTFARVLLIAANARRLGGDLAGAEVALGSALPFLAQAADRAPYCRSLALLRWEQGRVHEAAALLEQAAACFHQEGLAHERGTCLALLGLLLTEEAAYASALPILGAALAALETRRHPGLAVRAGLALALSLAETGQAKAARQARAEAWRGYRWLNREEDDLLALQWLAGKLAAGLGEREAGPLLEKVWRQCLRQGRLAEAALVTLDRGRGLREPQRSSELGRQIAEMETAFSGREGLAAALERLRVFAGEGENEGAAVSTASALRRDLRTQKAGLAPLPFA